MQLWFFFVITFDFISVQLIQLSRHVFMARMRDENSLGGGLLGFCCRMRDIAFGSGHKIRKGVRAGGRKERMGWIKREGEKDRKHNTYYTRVRQSCDASCSWAFFKWVCSIFA
jgi:hypothetical protein